MASNARDLNVSGEWICRDNQGWRVKVPCQNGHGYFSFKECGGSVGALNAARAFHAKMLRQLKADRKYLSEHGEKPVRETLNIRNRSGYTGISRTVTPCLNGRPLVVFTAYYNKNGRQYNKGFSITEFKHEEYALKAAVEWRKKMAGHR